jgi:hypothetical protein
MYMVGVTKFAEPPYGRSSLVTKLNPPREATSVDVILLVND